MRTYTGESLRLVSFPLGGLGAGMVCIEGTGGFGGVSVRNTPDVTFSPDMFAAVTVLGETQVSRVLEAPVPDYKVFVKDKDSGNGLASRAYGLPRMRGGEFSARFPFARVRLWDEQLPFDVTIRAWSPFVPGDEDASGLPFAAAEYTFENTSGQKTDAVYYFCAQNFMKKNDCNRVVPAENGFILEQDATGEEPYLQGAFGVGVAEPAYVDAAWFRGGWFDTRTMLWNGIARGAYADKVHPDPEKGSSPGGTIAVPFTLEPGGKKTIILQMSWYAPNSNLRLGKDDDSPCCGGGCACGQKDGLPRHVPWYTTVIRSARQGMKLWAREYGALKEKSARFSDCFFSATLPEELTDAVAANLSILKSPTILRQIDGRLWGWEGCCDERGCCEGTCTHVWNYAQAICNLFPRLERGMRHTEFYDMQDDETGHQNFRAYLPIRKSRHDFHAASDGQLGGIIKAYREWRIGGDIKWLSSIFPRIRRSIDFCIGKWDPDKTGVLVEPHHNTYDIEFWGPDGMCSSFYLGALKAICAMCEALGEDATEYRAIYEKGRAYLEEKLFNGEYFYQDVIYEGLREKFSYTGENAETKELLEREGPKYQYGPGCLSDGILGVWLSEISGLSDILDEDKVRGNLKSIYAYNLKRDLSGHANPQRPGYAIGSEGGLLLCTWPRGGKPSLPFVYSDEVWTGIEYQVAAHLMMKGYIKEGMDIVGLCRARYDGKVRNPFNEYECGHFYARAMASYALIQAYTGVRYDAVEKTLYACASRGDFKSFLATATGYGIVEVKDGKAAFTAASGSVEIVNIVVK